MKVLMIGDVVGRPGRKILLNELEKIKEETGADFISANLENASGGRGITEKNLKQLLNTPIDVVTMGNHTFGQRETINYIDNYDNMVRPINYPPGTPGKGYTIVEKNGVRVAVLNVSCQEFMKFMDSPFTLTESVIDEINENSDILLIDLHGEATAEKITYGYAFDGRASAITGTHTHVQTADNRVLDNGTAYITDIGMTGPLNGVIGTKKEINVKQYETKIPQKYEVDLSYPWQFNAVLIDIDENTGKARSIERIYKVYEEPEVNE